MIPEIGKWYQISFKDFYIFNNFEGVAKCLERVTGSKAASCYTESWKFIDELGKEHIFSDLEIIKEIDVNKQKENLYCKDCKYYRPISIKNINQLCTRKVKVFYELDLVDGIKVEKEKELLSCHDERNIDSIHTCGKEGKFFEKSCNTY